MPRQNNNLHAPRHWPLWAALGVAYAITRLPLSWQRFLGSALGRMLYYFGPRRRHIAAVNLRLCFPQLNEARRTALLKRSFCLYGVGVLEGFLAWWGSERAFAGRVEYIGMAHLRQARAGGRGVILLGGHFNTLEMGGRLLGATTEGGVDAIYRKHENPLFERALTRGRHASMRGVLYDRAKKSDLLRMLRGLRSGRVIWYGPDQDYGRGQSVFVPFLGVPAATITMTSRWAKITDAAVVPFFVRRVAGGFRVRILPPLDDFPSGDMTADALRVNRLIEREVKRAPENYIWAHRRFKSRPPGQPPVY